MRRLKKSAAHFLRFQTVLLYLRALEFSMILFGRETRGLPRDFIAEHAEMAIRIPMSESTRLRSFNLANSANIILFEALRQLGFPGLK